MTALKNDERIAILLQSLGEDLADSVLERLTPDQLPAMKSAIQQLETIPPTDEEITDVLEEFNRFMEFALTNSRQLLDDADAAADSTEGEQPEFVSTGDPFSDLLQLHDYQLAGALRFETGATIAVVLNLLPPERVGEVMRQLPESVRQDAFLRLKRAPQLPPPLLTKIVQTTVDRASRLDQTAASDPDHVADEKTANLLRSMDRKTRTEMLEALQQAEPEVAERVKGMLFVFEDILRMADKSIQRLLSEVESSELATALKNADEEILNRITSNLSKRARATLLEEIEFLGTVSRDREIAARQAVCELLAKLDQAGDLEMME